MALAIALIMYDCINRKKYVKAVIFAIVAISIHETVALMILMILLFGVVFKDKVNTKLIIIVGLSIFFVYDNFYSFITDNIESVSIYTEQSKYIPGVGTFVRIFVYLVIWIIMYKNRKCIMKNNKISRTDFYVFTFGIITMLFGIKNILFIRLSNYMTFFSSLLIPELYDIYKIYDKKIEKLVLYGALIAYFFVYISSYGGVLPYQTILM